MIKDKGIYILVIFLIIALYISTKSYNNFSLDKSIKACIIGQMKKDKSLDSKNAREFCEREIKIKKN